MEWLAAYEEETDDGGSADGDDTDSDNGDASDHEDDAASYETFSAGVDALVMGSTTYEQILGFGEWPYGERDTFVVTGRDLPLQPTLSRCSTVT